MSADEGRTVTETVSAEAPKAAPAEPLSEVERAKAPAEPLAEIERAKAPAAPLAEVECAGVPEGVAANRTAAVFFVGNRLMLDDGVAPAAYDALLEDWDIPDNVELLDVGCMSLDMLGYVERCDLILTVDAVDGTGDAPGTVYRFEPDAMARHAGPEASLHDLKLVDLFDAAALMGYEAEGFCLGMQVENPSPSEFAVGLTPACEAALPLLVETVVAELARRGFSLTRKER